jgi:hypothetical protein
MDLMQLHPKVADDSGDLLRQMEPQDAAVAACVSFCSMVTNYFLLLSFVQAPWI